MKRILFREQHKELCYLEDGKGMHPQFGLILDKQKH